MSRVKKFFVAFACFMAAILFVLLFAHLLSVVAIWLEPRTGAAFAVLAVIGAICGAVALAIALTE